MRICIPCGACQLEPAALVRRAACRSGRRVLPACTAHPASNSCRRPGFFFTSAIGTWWARQNPSSLWPSISAGAVQPFGVRSTIMGQRGRVCDPGRACLLPDIPDFLNAMFSCCSHRLVHTLVIRSLHKVRHPAIAAEKALQFVVADSCQQGWIVYFVAIQVQNWQYSTIANGTQELIDMPGRGKRTRLRFAIANHRIVISAGLSNAAPQACERTYPNSPPSWIEPGVSGVQ